MLSGSGPGPAGLCGPLLPPRPKGQEKGAGVQRWEKIGRTQEDQERGNWRVGPT